MSIESQAKTYRKRICVSMSESAIGKGKKVARQLNLSFSELLEQLLKEYLERRAGEPLRKLTQRPPDAE